LYSDGTLVAADETDPVIPPWIDPATEASFVGTGATWVSTDPSWPGGDGNTEGTPDEDQWRLFQDDFTLPEGAVVNSAEIWFSADNASEIYLNGSSIATTDDVYGAAPGSPSSNFSTVFNESFTPAEGENTLDFVVRNWESDADTNPTGLLYAVEVEYCVTVDPEDVTVTIVKFIDGEMATAETAGDAEFDMNSSWDAENIGAGSGSFSLGPVGVNSETPYTAVTSEMTSGADYSAEEEMGEIVDTTCENGRPFALTGYTSGDTLEEAAGEEPSLTVPELTDIETDKFIIVWNDDCATTEEEDEDGMVQVHIIKHLDGEVATASSSDGHLFDMIATWQAANLNGGAVASGTFVLGNNHGGAEDQYGAVTSEMEAPADYTASEVTDPEGMVLPLDADCEPGKFRLAGYRWSSTSFEDAASSTLQENAPEFVDLESDRFLIVDNEICPVDGEEEEDVELQVTVEVIDNTATANSTFEDGWSYLFHITAPSDEENLAMKFSDWLHENEVDTIPVANNMRISSDQADNGGATILLTAEDTYSSPDLVMVDDLDAEEAGRQVEVLVEVSIPEGTESGSYTTDFGVRTLP
jgi:hypothetical protein